MSIKHNVRADGNGNTKWMTLTASSAIKQFCRECNGFEKAGPRLCVDPLCPLFPFRVSGKPKDSV